MENLEIVGIIRSLRKDTKLKADDILDALTTMLTGGAPDPDDEDPAADPDKPGVAMDATEMRRRIAVGRMAKDAAAATDRADRFPNAGRLGRGA